MSFFRRGLAICAASALAFQPALAQVADPGATAAVAPGAEGDPHPPTVSNLPDASTGRLSSPDAALLRQALAAARSGARDRFAQLSTQITDPSARKLATWALIDSAGEGLSFYELERARMDLIDWPRPGRRLSLSERAIGNASLPPQQVVDWFNGQPPSTAEGAMALATALVQLNREPEAQTLIRNYWRDRLFEADPQRGMLSRFGSWLTVDDHVKRLDTLLMGPQGPAVQALLPMVPQEHQQLAQVRMALRAGRSDALAQIEALPESVRYDKGLAFEQSRVLRGLDRIGEEFELLGRWPQSPQHDDGAARLYSEARQVFVAALQNHNYLAAYDAMAFRNFPKGEKKAEAEFFAGWVALKKLNDPARAAEHFANVREAGVTPLTQGRALYWLGRAYEALGQTDKAQAFYREGGKNIGAFYGQLAAEKAGVRNIVLPSEPVLTPAVRQEFEGRDVIKAVRYLSELGEPGLFKTFVLQLDDTLTDPGDFAQLIDLVRNAGEPFTAMMVGRAAAGKGVIVPERMYPVLTPPQVVNAPDPAFVLAITRQESSFDPRARSPADARGMMMLLPSTARVVARQMGVPYADSRLWEADYNMQLGSFHLGQLLGNVSGSYILTAAGYNAGPGRPARWIGDCGDPRGPGADPVDFIECVPFTETRDYMMRVMENMQIYRARLNGGSAPLTLSDDLKRGASIYAAAQQPAGAPAASVPLTPQSAPAPTPVQSPAIPLTAASEAASAQATP